MDKTINNWQSVSKDTQVQFNEKKMHNSVKDTGTTCEPFVRKQRLSHQISEYITAGVKVYIKFLKSKIKGFTYIL